MIHFLFVFFLSQTLYGVNEVELDVHAVGQGNCITIKVPKPPTTDKEKYEYMIVDLGSSSYSNEKSIKKAWLEKTQEAQKVKVNLIANLQNLSLNPSTPPSEEKKTVQPRTVSVQEEGIRSKLSNKLIRWLYGEEVGENLQEFLKGETIKSEKIIKTIVITHPDSDHCNLLNYLLYSEVEKVISIENLILGGLPKRYEKGFKKIFNDLLEKPTPTKIYFPATGQYYEKGMDFDKVPEEAPHFYHRSPKQQQQKEIEKKLKIEMLEALKKQQFPSLEQAQKFLEDKPSVLEEKTAKAFSEAFDFQNKGIQISCLCANALHTTEESGRSVRIADDAPSFSFIQDLEESESKREHLYRTYNNADSIVLKLEYFGRSAILTGDATRIVTNRIAYSYTNDPEFLNVDVLIAGHHGSYSHGSNNPTWIKQTQPRYVFISNGTMYGHPYAEAYEAFKSSPRIEKRLTPHYVLITRKGLSESYNKTYDARLTFKGIYSTLSNGNLRVLFPSEAANLDQDKIENIVEKRLEKEISKKLIKKVKIKSKDPIHPPQPASKKIKEVIKGVKISLYKDLKKVISMKEEKENQSDEEKTEISSQIDAEDFSMLATSSPMKFPFLDKGSSKEEVND